MDPDATLELILEHAHQVRQNLGDETSLTDVEIEALSLAEGLISLHEWITSAGFLPSQWITNTTVPTPAQGIALAGFLRGRWERQMVAGAIPEYATVAVGGAGLPKDYLHVRMGKDGYEGGIDREGRVST